MLFRARIQAIGSLLWCFSLVAGFMIFPGITMAQTNCAPVLNGLVSWWAAEGDAVDQVGGNNGDLINGLGFTNGVVGQGFNFDGLDDAVIVPDAPSLNFGPGASLSIEAWILPHFSTTSYDILSVVDKRYAPNDSTSLGYEFGLGNGRPFFHLSDNGGGNGSAYFVSGPDLRDGIFHHIAVTVDRSVSNGGQIYVDGQPQLTFNPTTVPGDLSNSEPFRIGNHANPNIFAFFKGIIDEVAIYNRALAASEVLSIFQAGSLGKCTSAPPVLLLSPTNQTAPQGNSVTFAVVAGGSPPLTYQWTFFGTSLVNATDSSLVLTNLQTNQSGHYSARVANPYGQTSSAPALLTITPAPLCTNPPPNLVGWWRGENDSLDQAGGNAGTITNNVTFGPGRAGQAFVFDGNGSAVQLGNPASMQVQDFTIECWIKRASASVTSSNGNGNGSILSYANGGYGFYLDSSGHPTLTKFGVNNVSVAAAIADLSFHHLAVTKSGSTVLFYIDGAAYPAAAYNPGFTFTTPVAIGSAGDTVSYSFFGTIDELSFYSRALSTNEIQGIYTAGGQGKCVAAIPPFIVRGLTNQSYTIGSNVTLSIVAGGSPPLAYQWRFNSAAIAGSTKSAISVTNIQSSQAGAYSVMVSSGGGSVTSSAAISVVFPPAAIRVIGTNLPANNSFSLPVAITANGNENALGFSLNFDFRNLVFLGAGLGSGAPGAALIINNSQTTNGRIGLTLALPPNTTFMAGSQNVALVTFAALTTNSLSSAISFGDAPTLRQLLDPQINTLPATYSGAVFSIAAATNFEGDIFPRPNGDRSSGLTDWLQMGRYAARLDYPTNASEFQRADCAPRSSYGDGAITVADWVQIGRYTAGIDPLTVAAGPTNESPLIDPGPSADRLITLHPVTLAPGQAGAVSITLDGLGNENAIGFSVAYNPTLVAFTGADLGTGAAGVTLYVNTNQTGFGRVGIAMALSSGASFGPGSREILRVNFRAAPGISGNFAVQAVDLPVPRQISDPAAVALPASYFGGNVNILIQPPTLRIARSGTSVLLAWPLSASNYNLQVSTGALPSAGTWTNLQATPATSNNESVVLVPPGGTRAFYRLVHP